MVSKLEIYNGALKYVGTERLNITTGLTENVAARFELDREYDGAIKYMLEQAGWKFALRTVEITADPDIEPDFGPVNVFAKPDDYVRLAGISTGGDFEIGTEPEYYEEGPYFYSSNATLYLKYVSSGDDYGLNLGSYPQHYCEALFAWLAYNIVLPVSKDRNDRNDILAQHKHHLNTSKRLHAISDPVKVKAPGNWVRSRLGFRGPNFRNGRMTW